VSGELGELVAAPSQTVCFLARAYNDAIDARYRSPPDDAARPRPVSGCPLATPPPFQPRPPAVARPLTAASDKGSTAAAGARRQVRRASWSVDESPFVETLVNLTLHSHVEDVDLMNADEMLELSANILQTHCRDDRCAPGTTTTLAVPNVSTSTRSGLFLRVLIWRGLCVSECVLVTWMNAAKTAEPRVSECTLAELDEPCIWWGTHGRHLANTTERSVVGSDACCRFRYCNSAFVFE